MGIFTRLSQLIRANLNDLISRSEDPVKMLEQIIRDMKEQLAEAKMGTASVMANQKRLERQMEQEMAKSAEWERRAMLAIKAGNDELATEALERKREHDALAESFREQFLKQKTQVDQLRQAMRVLNDKVGEAERRKNLLIMRHEQAEVQKKIAKIAGSLNATSAFSQLADIERRIEKKEAEAEALTELSAEYSGDLLNSQFVNLERKAGAANDLLALKAKMGLVPVAPASAAVVEPEARPQVRVPAPAAQASADTAAARVAALSTEEQDELAAALAEIEAEEARQLERARR